MASKKLTVIYFTVVPLSSATNGGSIACRNHVTRLRQDPNIDVHVVAAPIPSDVEATEAFLNKMGGNHLVIPRRLANFYQERLTLSGTFDFAFKAATHFPWELEALNQPQYDEALQWAVRHWSADIIVIDYLFSALFCPQIMSGPTKTALITLNREAQFYRDMIRLGLIKHDPITAELSARRLYSFEKRAYEAATMVIALSKNDLPAYVPRDKTAVIIPYLDRRSPWKYAATGDLFFIGNIGHYPNREAIEFISSRLAPRLDDKPLRFKIIGASREDVPSEWRHPKVDFLGVSDAETARQLFMTSDCMICPISNTFGMKFKIAEAVAHGTPLIASSEALQCVPYLTGVPTFNFADVDAAAAIVEGFAGNKTAAQSLSSEITAAADKFIKSQATRWSDVLSSM